MGWNGAAGTGGSPPYRRPPVRSSWPSGHDAHPAARRLTSEAPASRLAHPRTEHFAPLFVTLGAAADELVTQRTVIDGFWHGMARRPVQFG